jgi:Rieske Fe-S protein
MSEQSSHAATPQTIPERRTFLSWVAVGLGGLATLAAALPFVGYLLGPLLRKPEEPWLSLGKVDSFPVGDTVPVTFTNPIRQPWDGITAQTTVFVRQPEKDKFVVFAENCAHLGCPVSWFPQSRLFMCPCHGGVYYEDGRHASGPPPRGLFECMAEVRENHSTKERELWIQAPHLPTLQDPLRKRGGTEGEATA